MASNELPTELEELQRLAKGAAGDFAALASVVRDFGKRNPIKETLNVQLKQARQLLKDTGGNVDAVKVALKGAGASGRDLSMIVKQLNGDLDRARRSAMGFEGVWQRILSPRTVAYAAHAMQALTGGFSIMRSAMSGPLGMAGSVIGKGIEMGKGLLDSVVEAAEFRQNALTGMTYMLGGDAEKARALFADAQKLAQETPLDTDKVIGGIKTFLTQGFSADQSKFLYKVVADQASKFLDQPEMEKNVVTAFSRLQGRGYATGEDLESLRVAGFRGANIMRQLQMQPGMEALFKGKTKLTGKETETEFFKKVREVLSSGQVGKGTMLNAAIGSLYEGQNLEEGPGSLAKKFGSESLTGALSNAKNAFGDMLKSMDLVNTKGFQALMKVLGDYSNMLTAADGPGKRLRETITGLVDSMLGGLANIKPKDMERMIDVIGALGKKVIGFFKEAWGWLDKLMHSEPGEFLTNVKGVLMDVGKYIGMGLWNGVKFAAVEGGKEALGVGSVDYLGKYGASKETLTELASRRGMSLESFAPQFGAARAQYDASGAAPWYQLRGSAAYAEGVSASMGSKPAKEFKEGGIVTSRIDNATIGEAGPEAVIPLSGKSGGLTISVPIQLFYAGSADPDDLSAALEPVAMRVFRNAWERLAMELG